MLGHVAFSEAPFSTLPSAGGATYSDLADFTGTGAVSFVSNGIFLSGISWDGVGTLNQISTVTVLGLIAYNGVGTASFSGNLLIDSTISFNGAATFSPVSNGIFGAAASFVGAATWIPIEYDAWVAYIDGLRELSADFSSPPAVVIPGGLSTALRPDAITFDLRTAFTLGPQFEAVPGGDILDRPWYVRNQGMNVFSARANDGNTAWEAENPLFSYVGVAITTLDCTFEQNARFVIAAERPTGTAGAPEIWIFWYNPSLAAYVFQNFGPGRNPQVVLDNPFETSNSDVLVGYMVDGAGFKIRVQSENYAVQRNTPWLDTSNWFLEELARLRGFRLGAFFSFRDTATGRYRIDRLESTLYPIYPQDDAFTLNPSMLSSTLVQAAINQNQFVEDAWTLALNFYAGSTLGSIIITHTQFVEDAFNQTVNFFVGSTLTNVVIVQTQFVEDAFTKTINFFTGSSLVTIVIVHNQPTDDAFTLNADVQGGSLAVA